MISEKIVVVDDDIRIHKSITLAFPEYEIISFNNGEDALVYLKKPNEINLVMLDVMMPGQDGITVLGEIKKINKDIKVILMTAYATKDIAIDALRNNADEFVEKPFQITELKEKINSILKEIYYPKNLTRDKNGQVARIKRFIERNYNNVKLDFIANELCLSSKYVSRLFKKKSASSFRDYKLQIKMDRAKSLLSETHLNVGEIAIELGYQNPESFMRIFRKMTNMTPSEFRRSKEPHKTVKSL